MRDFKISAVAEILNHLFFVNRFFRKKLLVWLGVFLFATISSSAQCPDKDSLWKRLIFFSDSSTDYPTQLKELLHCELLMKDCKYKNDSTYAFLLQRISSAYYRLGDYYDAIKFTQRAISIVTNNIDKPFVNPKHLVRYYYGLSLFYDSLGNFSEKMKARDSSIAFAVRTNSFNRFSAYVLYFKIDHLMDIGDYERCVSDASLGEELTKKYLHGDDSIKYIYDFHELKANALIATKNYDAVEQLYANKTSDFKKPVDYDLATQFEQLALVFTEKKDYNKAISYFEESRRIDEKNKKFLGCAITTYNEGYYLYSGQLGNKRRALFYYYKALQYADKAKKNGADNSIKFELLNILDNIGNVFVTTGLYDSALYFFQKAFDMVKTGMNETDLLNSAQNDFLQNKSINYFIELILDKGETVLKSGIISKNAGKIKEAIRIYNVADKLVERVNTNQTEFRSKLFWRKETLRLYENAIRACYLSNDILNSFYFFERSRAVLLNDQLSQLNKISNDDILRLAQVNKKILMLQQNINTSDVSSKNYAKIHAELFTAKQELETIQQSIKTHNPLYYQNFLDTNFVSLNDIRKKILTSHNAFVELFNGDSAVYSLIITAQKTYLNKIDKKDYDSTTNSYISFISNSDLLNSHSQEYNKTANYLYQLIFQNNSLPDGRIIISPDGKYFPFESLVTNTDFTQPDYFLNNHAVSYAYSARFLLNDFSSSNTSSKYNFLGIAPVNYASSLSLPSLNGSNKSLNEIENYFSGTNEFISERASKNNFANQFSKYKIIQLYTHASDTSANNEPAIFFADSALYLSELIPENKPSTQLIVLSACETANGQLYQGEGVFSFNRGFAALGIPSSVSNLWSVDDKSTYKLTELFYKYLAKGMPLDVALQSAKKEFIQTSSKQYSLPYYWAASVLVGKTDAIQLSNDFSWRVFLLSAAACLVLFFAAKYFIRRIFFSNKKTIPPTQGTKETAA